MSATQTPQKVYVSHSNFSKSNKPYLKKACPSPTILEDITNHAKNTFSTKALLAYHEMIQAFLAEIKPKN